MSSPLSFSVDNSILLLPSSRRCDKKYGILLLNPDSGTPCLVRAAVGIDESIKSFVYTLEEAVERIQYLNRMYPDAVYKIIKLSFVS